MMRKAETILQLGTTSTPRRDDVCAMVRTLVLSVAPPASTTASAGGGGVAIVGTFVLLVADAAEGTSEGASEAATTGDAVGSTCDCLDDATGDSVGSICDCWDDDDDDVTQEHDMVRFQG